MSSCSDEVLNKNDLQEAKQAATNIEFSFDAITAPSNWAKYQSLEQMLAACQIPESPLKAMTTEQLIKTCISHPLRLNYLSYNNEIAGAKVIVDNFNGFKELKSRADGAEKLIDFYEAAALGPQTKENLGADSSSELQLGFIELVLASDYIPEVFEGDNRAKIETVADQVLQKKLSKTDRSLSGIRHTMLVGAQAKLATKSLSADEQKALTDFVNASGMMPEADSYTKVSSIIAK